EFHAQPVARLRRATAADAVRDDDEILRGVERPTGGEQLVGEARHQPVLRRAAGAVQQQHGIDDGTFGVTLRRAEREVVQLELRQHLTRAEPEILHYDVAFALVRPGGRGRDGRRDGKKKQSGEKSKHCNFSPAVPANWRCDVYWRMIFPKTG